MSDTPDDTPKLDPAVLVGFMGALPLQADVIEVADPEGLLS